METALRLTAWSVSKSNIIKCNVTLETGASYGFKLHLENNILSLVKHFFQVVLYFQ